jgi:hypothetical protein
MRTIDCGTSGTAPAPPSVGWAELGLGAPWDSVIRVLDPGCAPRPAQVEALAKLRMLDTRRNLIVSAPTNAGKSLIGPGFTKLKLGERRGAGQRHSENSPCQAPRGPAVCIPNLGRRIHQELTRSW